MLRDAIEEIAAEYPTYGYRRVNAQLRRQDLLVNNKRVRRIMREMDLQAKTKCKKLHKTDSVHDFLRYPNLVQEMTIIRPDQLWVADIT